MKVSAISNNSATNFGGVRKVMSQINGATVTKFISSKGKELGEHVVAKNGDIAGVRRYVDGLTVQYGISHLPTYGTPSYATIAIHNTNPRILNGLTNGSYSIDSDYFLKNQKKLLTKKGIVNFLDEQHKQLEEGVKSGKVIVEF